jgi:hypothetical protein
MKIVYSGRFFDFLEAAPELVQKAFYKQLHFLARNLRHPSLRAKKYDESSGLWQARVTQDWRFYFTVEGDEYHLHSIKRHPK